MTLKIAKSVVETLFGDFAAEVEAHRQALLAHRFTGDAAPTAPAPVEQAVRRLQRDGEADDFVADYAIVDDTPPAPVLSETERRLALLSMVRLAEQQASHAIIGPGKLRLMTLDATRILSRPEAERSPEEAAVVARFAVLQARLAAVQYHAACLEAEIDDLVPAQFDGWAAAPFPS